jgi:hypothetical protein
LSSRFLAEADSDDFPGHNLIGPPVGIRSNQLDILSKSRSAHAIGSGFFLSKPTLEDSDDSAGNLKDETTKKLISQLLTNLVEWTRRIGAAPR